MGAANQSPSPAGTVDGGLLKRAVSALLKHHASSTAQSNQLLDDEVDVQVQFTLARIPGSPSVKPVRIAIPHPLARAGEDSNDNDSPIEADVCLIVKDEAKPLMQDMIARFPRELAPIKKVLTLSSLRSKHRSFSQKRELLARFDVFLADDRILPMLTKALGGKFFDKKKQPVPLNVCREEALPFAVQRALRATFMYLGGGTCVTVRAGNTSMPPSHLQSNIEAICTQAPLKVPRKWANIKSISIKTTSSVALPIYNKTLEELEQIKSMADLGVNAVDHAGDKEKYDKAETMEKEKKRKELADKSPLARALKKQKSVKKDTAESESAEDNNIMSTKTPKSSKKRKDKSDDEEKEEAEVKTKDKKVKSAKKTKQTNDEEDIASSKTPKTKKSNAEREPKSSKKSNESNDSSDNAPFIPSKKFTGSKSGYVYRKDKQGLGYYRDVLPVVDNTWLAKLKSGKVGGGGGGRKSIGHTPKKRRGNSRRIY